MCWPLVVSFNKEVAKLPCSPSLRVISGILDVICSAADSTAVLATCLSPLHPDTGLMGHIVMRALHVPDCHVTKSSTSILSRRALRLIPYIWSVEAPSREDNHTPFPQDFIILGTNCWNGPFMPLQKLVEMRSSFTKVALVRSS